MSSETAPNAKAAVEATLVLDTRRHEDRFGTRSLGFLDRRVLYRAPCAHIELRLPPSSGLSTDDTWLYGQYVVPDAATPVPGRVRVTIHQDSGGTRTVEGGETGDFALPYDPASSFRLECVAPDGSVVRLRCEV